MPNQVEEVANGIYTRATTYLFGNPPQKINKYKNEVGIPTQHVPQTWEQLSKYIKQYWYAAIRGLKCPHCGKDISGDIK